MGWIRRAGGFASAARASRLATATRYLSRRSTRDVRRRFQKVGGCIVCPPSSALGVRSRALGWVPKNHQEPVEGGGGKADHAGIGVRELQNQKNRAGDGDRTQKMRRDGDRVRRGDEAVAEKKRRGPQDHDDEKVRGERIGELPGHQHLRLSEGLREVLG